MGKVMRKGCWPCMLVGLGLILSGAGAFAQTGPSSFQAGGAGPGWMQWFTILLGALLAITGAYVRGLTTRLDKLELDGADRQRQISALRERVALEYHTKGELQAMVQQAATLAVAPLSGQVSAVNSSMDAIHRRLDAMGAPRQIGGRSLFQHRDDGA